MAEKSLNLPDDCWELIFTSMDHRYQLSPISLVSKTFLSITDRLAGTLVVSDATVLRLPSLLRRFSRLRSIDLSRFRGDADEILALVADSGLNIESLDVSDRISLPTRGLRAIAAKMKNLKSLNCSKIASLSDDDLVFVGEAFPSIEEIDISHPVRCGVTVASNEFPYRMISEAGVFALSSKAKSLKKIDLSGHVFVDDKAIDCLSANCLLLTEVSIYSCGFVTRKGVALLLNRCKNLNSVSLTEMGRSDFRLDDAMSGAKSLRCVDLRCSIVTNDLLRSMGESLSQLDKLGLSDCVWFTFEGISFLLSKHRSVKELDLEGVSFFIDDFVAKLVGFLRSLTRVNLSSCRALTERSFFKLTTNCPFLSEINMGDTTLGILGSVGKDVSVPAKTRIKRLYLGRNRCLGDACLKSIASVCPNLEILDVSFCSDITANGILEALKQCNGIRELNLNHCSRVKSFALDWELPKLEVLCASDIGIDDSALESIGNHCPRILQLDLTGCLRVTAKGVKEIVNKCKSLREINLKWCNNVGVDIVAWMVFSRPTLKRIVPPNDFIPSESQRSFFLRHGCLVCDGC